MAKRRTKKQKAKTAKLRNNTLKIALPKKRKVHNIENDYDSKLLSQDLLKTLLVSGVVLGGQLALYFFYFK